MVVVVDSLSIKLPLGLFYDKKCLIESFMKRVPMTNTIEEKGA